VKESLHPVQMTTENHVAMDARWTGQEVDRFGAEQSWKELSSTRGTSVGLGEARVVHVNGVVPPLYFLK
jgi:hypothetical protein